jgi:3-dehydroquinate synthase
MEPLSFVFADRATVPGWLGTDVQEEVIQHILGIKPDLVLLVTDETVDSLHGNYFSVLTDRGQSLGETGSGANDVTLPAVEKFVLPDGDACKSWANLTALMEWAFSIGATKSSLVVAFGGGAVMNVTGLFATMLYRGSKLVYVPTTLLAMHDVTTSLKTSICFDGRKNNIGTFYAPMKILIDVAFCRTLPRGEIFSAIGELAKNATLFGGKHAEGFCKALNSNRINNDHGGSGEEFVIDDSMLSMLLALGIEAKMTVLLSDAYEKTSGMIFEYGHTVSHAIEKAYGDGVIPHGIGVTYGLTSSSYRRRSSGS